MFVTAVLVLFPAGVHSLHMVFNRENNYLNHNYLCKRNMQFHGLENTGKYIICIYNIYCLSAIQYFELQKM